MNSEKLNISIIYGTGSSFPPLPELLKGCPQVEVTEQFYDSSEFLKLSEGVTPDTMVVYTDGMTTPPEWIEDLTRKFPQAPVLLCSESKELEFLMRAMQLGVREFLPLPLSQEVMGAALERVRLAKRRLSGPSRSTVVVVAGHKGGVGTTAIALNLAVALAELQNEPTALVDLGRPFPDIGNFLDHETTYNLRDVIQNLGDLDQSFFKKIMEPYGTNLAILHGISDFKEQDGLNLEGVWKIFPILRGLYKHIVVDLGHLFDELFFRVLKEADLVLMLTELNVPNFRNFTKLWPMLKEWDPMQQKVKIVVNRHNTGNKLGMSELEKILGEPPYAILPTDYLPLDEAINQGVPLAKVGSRSKIYLGLKDVAQKIISSNSAEEKSTIGSNPRRRFWLF